MEYPNNSDSYTIGDILGTGGTATGGTGGTTSGTGGIPTDIVSGATQALQNIAAFLPAGGLKDFLSNPIGTVTKAIGNLLSGGRTYQTGQYRLGERFMRHILQKDPTSYRNVPDEMVPAAQVFFTSVLGVDINNDEDLQSLYLGVEEYFLRPDKVGIPRPAVVRAVNIMKLWPMTNPNNPNAWYVPWPIDVIFNFPSDPSSMGYFSTLINKQLPIPIEGKGGETTIGDNPTGDTQSSGKSKLWLWILIIIAAAAIIYFAIYKNKK